MGARRGARQKSSQWRPAPRARAVSPALTTASSSSAHRTGRDGGTANGTYAPHRETCRQGGRGGGRVRRDQGEGGREGEAGDQLHLSLPALPSVSVWQGCARARTPPVLVGSSATARCLAPAAPHATIIRHASYTQPLSSVASRGRKGDGTGSLSFWIVCLFVHARPCVHVPCCRCRCRLCCWCGGGGECRTRTRHRCRCRCCLRCCWCRC